MAAGIDLSSTLADIDGQLKDHFRTLSNGFQKLDKIKDPNRQSKQLEELTGKMRECKWLIEEFDREFKEEESRNPSEINRQLNEKKKSMIKELNSYVALRKTYANSVGNKRVDLFEGGTGGGEAFAEENIRAASSMTNQELVGHGTQMMDETDQAIDRTKKLVEDTVNVGEQTGSVLKAQVASVEVDFPQSPKSPGKKLNNLTNQLQKWNPKDASHVLAVKTALHLSEVPKSLICREEEQKKLFDFCKTCIEKEKVGSLYVCGCPGTGKSLLLEKVRSLSVEWAKEARIPPPNSVVINCTTLTNTSDIFKTILEQCQGRKNHSAYSSPFEELKSLLCQKKNPVAKKMMLLIIDEMDFLINRDQSVLYDLFRLPSFPNSQCMLIGISNAIDLTDRFLPKLQSLNCKPLIMTFRAYSKDQILKILKQRLKDLPFQAFQPQALELCARKVAAASGDMRKALHVCRDAVEMLQFELTDGIYELNRVSNEKEHGDLSLLIEGKLTKQEMHMVRIDHMARSLAKTFRSAVVDTIRSLPQHQQIVLCSAVKFFRRGKKDATLGELNAAYLDFCKTTSMHPLTGPEFLSMCRVLSDQALLNLGHSREDRLRRVTLKVDEGDVIFALQGIRFFRNCLQ